MKDKELKDRLNPNHMYFQENPYEVDQFTFGEMYEILSTLREELLQLQTNNKLFVLVKAWDTQKNKECETQTLITILLKKINNRMTMFDQFFDNIVNEREKLPSSPLNFQKEVDRNHTYKGKKVVIDLYHKAEEVLKTIQQLTEKDNIILFEGDTEVRVYGYIDNVQRIYKFKSAFKRLPQVIQDEVTNKLSQITERYKIVDLYTDVINLIDQVENYNYRLDGSKSFEENVKLSKKPEHGSLTQSIKRGLPYRV